MQYAQILSTLAPLILLTSTQAQSTSADSQPAAPASADVKLPEPPRPPPNPMIRPELEEPCPPVFGPAAPEEPLRAGHGYLLGFDRTQVLFDEPGDDRIWAAGDTFKASFGREGATFVPFFGSAAPRNFPVRFALRSVRAGGREIAFDAEALPVRDGNRVVFDRGIVDEVYDVTPTAIEQSFVIESRLEGEIVLDVDAESELERASDGEGLVLRGEHGSVRYGRAFALDARAGRTELDSGWNESSIRIAVPAPRVAASAWPLVVDPVITTFDIDDNGVYADSRPDVAFEASFGIWMTVYERAFSATDHDIVYRLIDTNGIQYGQGYIDYTTVYWAMPRVANNTAWNQFLCVAQAGDPDGGARTIRGRTRASDGSLGIQFQISGSETGDKVSPDVGGDATASGSSYYCVVYEREYSSTDRDILARLVTTTSMPASSTIFLSNSAGTLDLSPSISQSAGLVTGSQEIWNVAWHRHLALFQDDLWGARIRWDGSIAEAPFAIDTSSLDTHSASVSSSTSGVSPVFMVACQRGNGGSGTATFGYVINEHTLIDYANLSWLAGSPATEPKWYPSVDCDGNLFVVADQEANGSSSDYDVYASTFQLVGNQITLAEGHQLMAGSSTAERTVEVACARSAGGPARTSMLVWHDVVASNVGDIEGGSYSASPFAQFCDPGVDNVMACPCGNAPGAADRGCNNSAGAGGARIVASGTVAPDTVVLRAIGTNPSSLCLFLQGNGLLASGVAFGDGVRCVGGQLLRLATKTASAGIATFPGPGDASITARCASLGFPILAGTKRYYSVYYRDPGTFGCAATFNITNAMQIQW